MKGLEPVDRQCLQPVFVKKQLQYLPQFESFDLEQNHGSICPADDYLSLSPGSLGSQQMEIQHLIRLGQNRLTTFTNWCSFSNRYFFSTSLSFHFWSSSLSVALSFLVCSAQGSGPEDFSHLPPEQRRKKLQGKIDELNKDIQKEMDQRYSDESYRSSRTPKVPGC